MSVTGLHRGDGRPVPDWLRYDLSRVEDAIRRRGRGNGDLEALWRFVVRLLIACDDLDREPERDAELAPVALGAARTVAEMLPAPPPVIGDSAAPDADSEEAVKLLRQHAAVLLALLTAPPDAPIQVSELSRAVADLSWLLGIWTAEAEMRASCLQALREFPPEPEDDAG